MCPHEEAPWGLEGITSVYGKGEPQRDLDA